MKFSGKISSSRPNISYNVASQKSGEQYSPQELRPNGENVDMRAASRILKLTSLFVTLVTSNLTRIVEELNFV
jgi:hypothetical protein